MPNDCPRARGDRQRSRRQGDDRKAQHRRKPGYAGPLWRSRHSHHAIVQGRPADCAEGRCCPAQPDPAVARVQSQRIVIARRLTGTNRRAVGSLRDRGYRGGIRGASAGRRRDRTRRSCYPRICEIPAGPLRDRRG